MTSWRRRPLPSSFVRSGLGPRDSSITDVHGAPSTWWNGRPTPARKVQLQVGMPPAGRFPGYWAVDLVGVIVEAVRVEYEGDVFYLDNHDGSGWRKVTDGRGSPIWPSASLFGTEVG